MTDTFKAIVRVSIGVVLLVAAVGSVLIAWAARADFRFRGCDEIPREAWYVTANCNDAWSVQVFYGVLSLVLGVVFVALLIRRRRTLA